MATVLITGVSAGIGLALTKEFIKLGHTVVACARNNKKIAILQQEYGLKHDFQVVDIRDARQVNNWAKRINEKYPQIDMLINNAGTKTQLLPLWEVSAEDFTNTINTNLIGSTNVLRSFIPAMIVDKSGSIINFSSEWGHSADAKVAAYCASKYAIEGLTLSLAKELPEGIITIALNPLIVYTELLERCKSLLLPGEYELGVSPEEWAAFAAPKMLALTKKDHGSIQTWSPKLNNQPN